MTGYVNGSDLLIKLGTDGAIGHCTSHTCTYSTETKDVAVKPAASQAASNASLFKNKRVTGLSVQIQANGIKFYQETEAGFKVAVAKWALGQSVPVSAFERGHDSTPYVSGNFIITSLKEDNPAGEDATYDITLDNDGAVTVDATKVDLNGGSSSGGGSSTVGSGSGNGTT